MNRLSCLLTGAGLGAGLMYLLDPERGNRRRSLAVDQVTHALNKSIRGADATLRDMQNRAYGSVAQLRSSFETDQPSDEVLVNRVRSKLGRYTTHPKAIVVTADKGHVTLSGPILAHEMDDVLWAAGSVRGVMSVENRLEVHESAENISALQGHGDRWGEPAALMQSYWSPTTRLVMGAAGSALMLGCVTRRTPLAALLGTAGFGLMLRAMTNLETRRLIGAGGRRGIDFKKTITIHRPVEEVFDVLTDPASYPLFSDMFGSVKDLGGGRYQKTICGPAGAELKVTERVTGLVPNEFFACRSESDSPVQYAARVRFVPDGENATKVEIDATYNPPGGVLSHSFAWLVGLDPKSVMDDVLMRAKSYLETGKVPHDAAVHAGVHAGHEAAVRH